MAQHTRSCFLAAQNRPSAFQEADSFWILRILSSAFSSSPFWVFDTSPAQSTHEDLLNIQRNVGDMGVDVQFLEKTG